MELVSTDELKPRARSALDGFVRQLAGWRAQADSLTPEVLAEQVLDESGYTAMWQTINQLMRRGGWKI